MIVTIHQPHFLPWLGYMHRMAQADLFVLLDHVQFERGHAATYQNRTRFRMHNKTQAGESCEARWLTVPVVQRSHTERILDKEIDTRGKGACWRGASHYSLLRHAYREAPHLNYQAHALKKIFNAPWTRLVDLSLASIEFLREAFDIRTPIVRSSELGVSGAKSELIIDICRAVGADVFLGGLGGTRTYLDAAAFERAGIGVQWQEFRHPAYRQCGPGPFMPGLSSIDLLWNCGPQSRSLLLADATASKAAATHDSRAAA
jgi:hypothetical protein